MRAGEASQSPCGGSRRVRLRRLLLGGVPVFDGVDPRYKRVLWTVIAINAAMFVIEMSRVSWPARRRCRPTPWTSRGHSHLRPEPRRDRREPA